MIWIVGVLGNTWIEFFNLDLFNVEYESELLVIRLNTQLYSWSSSFSLSLAFSHSVLV